MDISTLPVVLPETRLFGDLAFADKQLVVFFNHRQTALITGKKKPKDTEYERSAKH